ncbi:MAG TPA: Calx-beta domain-containing protein [Nitrospiraceae bacterium]|nr:Calx-beta domain-containing protein [Nitrospiraceae bacterium]
MTQVETNTLTTTFTFTVQLSAPAKAGGVGFTVNTADGTTNPAVAASDYVAIVSGSGSIAAGNSSTTVSVTVNGDTVFEPDETFFVNLTNITGASATDSQGLGTIANEDAPPAISIADASITEGASGTSLITFTVTLTGTSQSTVRVSYATADSSATSAGSDYDTTSGTLNFAPGDPSETFTVPIHGDPIAEGDEVFLVNLSSPSGASINDNQALGIILMDDPFSVTTVNTAYTENFDGLAQTDVSGTTPTAWTRAESGSAANRTYTANNGGSTTGDTYSYGSTTTPTDRALGGLRTGNLVPTVGAFYRNDTGSTLNTLQIAYTGEQWRLGNAGRPDRLDFQYSTNANSLTTGTWTDVDLLDFPTPNTTTTGSKDGNNATNRTAITNTITGLSIGAGSTFWIRWTDVDASGADDGLAVDDFSISAGVDTPALSIGDVTAAETNGGTTTFNFNVHLTSPAPPGGVSFAIKTADGTTDPANAGIDYVSIINGTGSIAQNGTSTTVSVTVKGDTDSEPNETFFVNLSGVTGATVNDGQGLGTIMNDDAPAASADLSVSKNDSPDPVAIGNDITYTITVTNAGPDAAVNAVLAETVPTNTTFRSITPPASWTCPTQPAVGGTGAISCANASFVIGSAIFTLVVRVGTSAPDGLVISNTASVSSSTSDPNPGSESAIQTTTVKQPSLVISQIYPGGGNAGATYTNDFIEIFNRGTTTVDFAATNYSLQYTSQAGNFGGTASSVKFDLTSGTIAPGRYFLVQAASGGVNGVALPAPDVTSLIVMSATAGKVVLVLGTTVLAVDDCPGDDNVSPFNPNFSTIVDFVGYGGTAASTTCYEGSGPAPFSTSTAGGLDPDARSTIRTSRCTDTGSNSSDFSNPTTAPTARNTATATNLCP